MSPVDTRKITSSLIFAAAILPGWTLAATTLVPSAPSGFNEAPDGFSTNSFKSGGGDSPLDGFTFTTLASGTYDSNIFQRAAQPGRPEKDDFILGVGGKTEYHSKSTGLTFGGYYVGNYNYYLNESGYSSYNQAAGADLNYDVGRISSSLVGRISYDEGNNRDYDSAFVKETTYRLDFSGRYRMSQKTSLLAEIGQSYSNTEGDRFSNTEAFDIGGSALWKYSPLTEWGPGLRYTYRAGSSQLGRSSIGPIMRLNYKLSTKMALTSRVGMDFVDYDEGGSADPTLSASLGVSYQASKLWGMNFSFYRDTEADPTNVGGFSEVSSVRLGYNRKIRRALLDLGVVYTANRKEIPDGIGASTGSDRDYFSANAKLGMLIFSDTTAASLFLRYSEQSSSTSDTWDGVQVGVTLSRNF